MSYESEAAQFDENVALSSTDKPATESGYVENFIFGVGQTVDKSLTISRYMVESAGGYGRSDRNKKLNAMRKDGDLTDEEYQSFVEQTKEGAFRPNYNAMAKYAKSKGLSIESDQELHDQMRDAVKERTALAQDVFSRQSGAGFAGEILGGFVGYGLEPANLAAIPLEAYYIGRAAYTLSQATTRLGRAARVAGISGATNMAVEVGIQPVLFNWHEQIGEDMTWGDALLNVVSVGVLSGGITGIASGARTKGRFADEQAQAVKQQETIAKNDALREKIKTEGVESLNAKEVADILSDVRKASKDTVIDKEGDGFVGHIERELKSTDPNVNAKEHFEKIDAAEKKANEYQSPPVAKEDLEPVIDDAQLDMDYTDALLDDLYMNDLTLKDLDPENHEFGMFGFDEVGVATKGDVGNAIKQIENADKKMEQLDVCLLGGGAPF